MNKDEDYLLYDYNRRAREIIAALTKDGYPDEGQLAIVCGIVAILLAETAESAEHLAEGVSISKELIEQGSKMWFEEGRSKPTGR